MADETSRAMIHSHLQTFLDDWRVKGLACMNGTERAIGDPVILIALEGRMHAMAVSQKRSQEQEIIWSNPLFNPLGVDIALRPDGDCQCLAIVLRDLFVRFAMTWFGLDGLPRDALWFHCHLPVGRLARQQLGVAQACAFSGPPNALLPAFHALLQLLHHQLGSAQRLPLGKARRSWLATREFLTEHCHLPITRESVAATIGLNPSYLSRLFQREAGTSFSRYLNRLRLERAARLLQRSTLPVDTIAGLCGFLDSVYFIRLFREHFGSPPGRFRKSALQAPS